MAFMLFMSVMVVLMGGDGFGDDSGGVDVR